MTLVLKHLAIITIYLVAKTSGQTYNSRFRRKCVPVDFSNTTMLLFFLHIQTDLVIEIILTCQRGLEESLAES